MASRFALQRYQNSLPSTGDFVQGGGPSTAQRSNPNVVASNEFSASIGTTVAPATHNAPWAQPVPVWFALFAILIVAKYAAERSGEGGEFSSIRIGFWNMIVVFAMWLISSTVAKWVFGYWRIPGISSLVLAA